MKERNATLERFLAEIGERVNPGAIQEAHLFQPIKQGGTESGVAVIAAAAENAVASRLAVYTAKYRLTLKGPDRGKWEFAMQAEADAPLTSVDKVVLGVTRRSGDEEEPQRLSGDEFRDLLPPRETTPATPSFS